MRLQSAYMIDNMTYLPIPSEQKCKSGHTVKRFNIARVAPNVVLVYCCDWCPGSTSDAAIVEHSKSLDHYAPRDMAQTNKSFNKFDKLPSGASLNIPPFKLKK